MSIAHFRALSVAFGVFASLLSGSALGIYSTTDGMPNDGPDNNRRTHWSKAKWEASNFAPKEDVARWQSWRYGMFIHFGLTAKSYRDLSWHTARCKSPDGDFDPGALSPDAGAPLPDDAWTGWTKDMKLEKFDAKEWVKVAKEGGFQYMVVVAKHHEGFHMWDTEFSDFKITKTPFGRDYLKELADACHAAGMPLGLYYSQRDWYHPFYQPADQSKIERVGKFHWKLKPGQTSPLGERHAKYLDYQKKAVRELCTKYGKIDILWWDAASFGGMFTAEMWDAENLTRMVRELQPHIVMNNRCSVPGDFDSPEQRLGTYQDWRPWETCMTLGGAWCYNGSGPKPLAQRIRSLAYCACGDGNLLLSWGPHWDGAFDAKEIAAQKEMGEWLKVHGEAIYGTRSGPWKPAAWGGSTRKGKTAYLHILDLPKNGQVTVPAVPGAKLVSARILGRAEKADLAPVEDGKTIVVALPPEVKGAPDTIVELVFDAALDGIAAR